MAYYQIFLLIALAIVVVALCIPPICDKLLDIVVYGDQGYGRAKTHYLDEQRAAGVSEQDSADNLFLREEFARFRREASDLVGADVDNWYAHIATARRAAFDRIAVTHKDLLPSFAMMLSGLNYGHVLYQGEAMLVDQHNRGDLMKELKLPHEDQIAALRIVKPS